MPQPKLKILGAAYGAQDVTDFLSGEIKGNKLSVKAEDRVFGETYEGRKALVIVYQYDSLVPQLQWVKQNKEINISYNSQAGTPDDRPPEEGKLQVLAAIFGHKNVLHEIKNILEKADVFGVRALSKNFGGTDGGKELLVMISRYGAGPAFVSIGWENFTRRPASSAQSYSAVHRTLSITSASAQRATQALAEQKEVLAEQEEKLNMLQNQVSKLFTELQVQSKLQADQLKQIEGLKKSSLDAPSSFFAAVMPIVKDGQNILALSAMILGAFGMLVKSVDFDSVSLCFLGMVMLGFFTLSKNGIKAGEEFSEEFKVIAGDTKVVIKKLATAVDSWNQAGESANSAFGTLEEMTGIATIEIEKISREGQNFIIEMKGEAQSVFEVVKKGILSGKFKPEARVHVVNQVGAGNVNMTAEAAFTANATVFGRG